MGSKLEIACDHCGKQLNVETASPHIYGIHVSNKDYRVAAGGIVHAVMMYPCLDEDLDFCDQACLIEHFTALQPGGRS